MTLVCTWATVSHAVVAKAGPTGPESSQAQVADLHVVHQFGGAGFDIEVEGEYGYASQGYRVSIFKWAVGQPHFVGRTEVLPALVTKVAIADRVLYVADSAGGLSAFDVARPTQPILLDRRVEAHRIVDIAAAGGYLVAAFSDIPEQSSLVAPDSADFLRGATPSGFTIAGRALDSAIAPTLATIYAHEGAAMHPAFVAYVLRDGTLTPLPDTVDRTRPISVDAMQDFFIAATRSLGRHPNAVTLHVDSKGLHPVGTAELSCDPIPARSDASGELAVMMCQTSAVILEAKHRSGVRTAGLIGGADGLFNLVDIDGAKGVVGSVTATIDPAREPSLSVLGTLDLSDPAQPDVADIILESVRSLGDLVIDGEYVWSLSPFLGISGLTADLRPLGSETLPGVAMDVVIDGGYAYVASSFGVTQVDLTDTARAVSRFTAPTGSGGISRLHVRDGLLYASALLSSPLRGHQRDLGTTHVVEIPFELEPETLGSLAEYATGLDTDGTHGYIAGPTGTSVFRIADRGAPPVLVSPALGGGAAGAIAVEGGALVSLGERGVCRLELRFPELPRLTSCSPGVEATTEILSLGGPLYAVASTGSITVVKHEAPLVYGVTSLSAGPGIISITGVPGRIYALSKLPETSVLHAIDFDGKALQMAGSLELPPGGTALRVTSSDNRVYVAMGAGGVVVVEDSDIPTTPPTATPSAHPLTPTVPPGTTPGETPSPSASESPRPSPVSVTPATDDVPATISTPLTATVSTPLPGTTIAATGGPFHRAYLPALRLGPSPPVDSD